MVGDSRGRGTVGGRTGQTQKARIQSVQARTPNFPSPGLTLPILAMERLY